MTLNEWQCLYCKHYIGNSTCKAFPDGIPQVIYESKDKHSKPLEGQENSLTFEPIK